MLCMEEKLLAKHIHPPSTIANTVSAPAILYTTSDQQHWRILLHKQKRRLQQLWWLLQQLWKPFKPLIQNSGQYESRAHSGHPKSIQLHRLNQTDFSGNGV